MNMVEFAKRIGVSTATVSYVINNKENNRISETTKQMILSKMKELGYRPNYLARALKTQRSRTIALWTHDIYPPYYTRIISKIKQLLIEDGYELLIVNLPFSNSNGIARWPVEGIITFAQYQEILKMIETAQYQGVPAVNIGSVIEPFDSVRINTYDAAIGAVRHLINTGRSRIAYVQPEDVIEYKGSRSDAYTNVMKGAGLVTEFIRYPLEKENVDRLVSRENIKKYIKNKGCPDALFCSDDELAIGAFRGLRDLDIRIPDDVAIIGCDGIIDSEYIDPQISTIIQPVQQICEVAWRFLKNRMADPDIPQQYVCLEAKLALRGSSGASSK